MEQAQRCWKYMEIYQTYREHPIPMVFEDLGAMIRLGRTHGEMGGAKSCHTTKKMGSTTQNYGHFEDIW
jgi:hypothetical protein